MSYPWCYIHRHPILVLTILWDYRQRRKGARPDKWHPFDVKLFNQIFHSSKAGTGGSLWKT